MINLKLDAENKIYECDLDEATEDDYKKLTGFLASFLVEFSVAIWQDDSLEMYDLLIKEIKEEGAIRLQKKWLLDENSFRLSDLI